MSKKQLSFLFVVASILTACGGTDTSPADTSPAPASSAPAPASPAPILAAPAPTEVQGVFAGTSSSGFAVLSVHLDDGSVFGIQGKTTDSVFTSNGFVRATGNYANGTFVQTQTAFVYAYYGGSLAASLSGSYTPGGAFNWSLVTSAGSSQWTTAKLSSEGYDYDHAATLADLSGNWSSRLYNGDASTTLTISATGEMTGGDFYGCHFTGLATPRPGGKNVFNISLTAEGSNCDVGSTATGVGIILRVSSTARELVLVANDGGSGLVWTGVQTQPAASLQPAASAPSGACAPPVEGQDARIPDTVAGGTIAGGADPSFMLVVLGEKRLLFYGPDLPGTNSISGFVYAGNPGPWCTSSDPGRTYNGIDRNLRLKTESRVYLYATVKTDAAALAGSIRYPDSTYTLTGGAIPGSSYDGAAKPSLADAIGSWSMTGLDGKVSHLSINEAGVITGSDRGCDFSGTIAASSDGSANLLRVQLKVPTCDRQTLDFPYEGFAVVLPMKSGAARLLLWADTNNGVDWDAIAALGSRN